MRVNVGLRVSRMKDCFNFPEPHLSTEDIPPIRIDLGELLHSRASFKTRDNDVNYLHATAQSYNPTMFCLRAWIPLLFLSVNASPLFVVTFFSLTYILNRPCTYFLRVSPRTTKASLQVLQIEMRLSYPTGLMKCS